MLSTPITSSAAPVGSTIAVANRDTRFENATAVMIASLGSAAGEVGMCNETLARVGSNVDTLKSGLAITKFISGNAELIVSMLDDLMDVLTKQPVKGAMNKVPKFGTLLNIALKVAKKGIDVLGKALEPLHGLIKKLKTVVSVADTLFAATGLVVEPTAEILAAAHAQLANMSATGCAPDALEAINSAAANDGAIDSLAALEEAGDDCVKGFAPIVRVLDDMADVMTSIADTLMAPVEKLKEEVDNFVDWVNSIIGDLLSALEDEAAACALEVFKPLTQVIDLATCPVDDLIAASTTFVVDPVFNALQDFTEKVSQQVLRTAVEAIVPDNIIITIPDFLPSIPVDEWWSAECEAAIDTLGTIATHAAALDGALPYQFNSTVAEQQIINAVSVAIEWESSSFQSACVEAWEDMLADASDYPNRVIYKCAPVIVEVANYISETGDDVEEFVENTVNDVESWGVSVFLDDYRPRDNGEICVPLASCRYCVSGHYELWLESSGLMSSRPRCGRQELWADGTPCLPGTTCKLCQNGASWWDKAVEQRCGQEPCWGRNTVCFSGVTCDNCCDGSRGKWYWVGFRKCN